MPTDIPPVSPWESNEIALVLGGGGARGLAHAGVISVLEENNIPFDFIVGTSIGSVAAAIYADEPNSVKLKEKMINVRKWDVLDLNFYSSLRMLWGIGGFANGCGLKKYLQRNITSYTFNDLKIPIAVVTTDVQKGEILTLRSGPIIPAVHASSAIPIVFAPVLIYDRMLVDGGVISPVPVEVAKALGAKKIIAVDIGAVVQPRRVVGSFDLADRSLWLSYIALTKYQVDQADVVIQPLFDTSSMFDDTHLENYYEAGRLAALKALPALKRLSRKS